MPFSLMPKLCRPKYYRQTIKTPTDDEFLQPNANIQSLDGCWNNWFSKCHLKTNEMKYFAIKFRNVNRRATGFWLWITMKFTLRHDTMSLLLICWLYFYYLNAYLWGTRFKSSAHFTPALKEFYKYYSLILCVSN